jgi:hypothetical protein
MKTLLNVVFFQVLWLCCVAGAGRGYAWIGLPVFAVFCIYHFWVSGYRKADALLLLACVVIGGACDTLLLQAGFLRFEQNLPLASLAPIWILLLWAGFALTLNHSMSFFKTRTIGATVFGILGGPLAYWVAKDVWKAVQFTAADWQVYAALAVIWGILTPTLLALGDRLMRRFPDHAGVVKH